MTPHNMVGKNCKACGAEYAVGSFWSAKDSTVEVSKDCDEARRQMYPVPRSETLSAAADDAEHAGDC